MAPLSIDMQKAQPPAGGCELKILVGGEDVALMHFIFADDFLAGFWV